MIYMMKNLKKFCKLANGEASLADKSPQGTWLEFFSSAGNAKMPSIGMVKDGMPSFPVVKIEASPSKGFDGVVSSCHGQL